MFHSPPATRTSLATIGASMRAKIFHQRRGVGTPKIQWSLKFIQFLWFSSPKKIQFGFLNLFMWVVCFEICWPYRTLFYLWSWWTRSRHTSSRASDRMRLKPPARSLSILRFEMKTFAKVFSFVFVLLIAYGWFFWNECNEHEASSVKYNVAWGEVDVNFFAWTVCNDFSELRFR